MSNLSFSEYQEKAKETALYPNVGNNPYYPTLGLTVAAVASEFGLDMGEIAQKNYEKLKKRQEEGKIKGNGDNR